METINYAKEAARNKKERKEIEKKAKAITLSAKKQRESKAKSNASLLTSKGLDVVLDYLTQLDPRQMTLPVVIRSNTKRRWWRTDVSISKENRLRMKQMGLGLVAFSGDDDKGPFGVLVPRYRQQLSVFLSVTSYMFVLSAVLFTLASVLGVDEAILSPLVPWPWVLAIAALFIDAANKVSLLPKPNFAGLSFELAFFWDDRMDVCLRDKRSGRTKCLKNLRV